jgi:multisubunit Na+/H+ antiporter MnhB subunit
LLLRAPDVVPTHVVVEVLTLIILLRAVVGRETVTFAGVRPIPLAVASGVLVLMFLTFAVMSFSGMPEFGRPSMIANTDAPSRTYISEGLKETGAPNAVTAVLLDYRAYDTLGEATVIFTAIVGAVVLLRRKSRKRRELPMGEQGGNSE